VLLYSKLASLLFPHVPDVASALASIIGNTGADALDPEGDGADQPVGERANGRGGDGNDGFSVEAAAASSDATDRALSGSLSTLSDARLRDECREPQCRPSLYLPPLTLNDAGDSCRCQPTRPDRRGLQRHGRFKSISRVLVQALSQHSPTALPPARRPTRPAHLQGIWKT
jgi:hypothetical protein